jgi:hypothetical protein
MRKFTLAILLICFAQIACAALPGSFDSLRVKGSGVFGKSSSAAASSILDITSTTKGLLIPRMTTAQKNAIASPDEGLLVWDTDLNTLAQWTGSAWESMGDITAHTGDSTDAHDASAISVVPDALISLTGDDVQEALDDIYTWVDYINSTGPDALAHHIAGTGGVFTHEAGVLVNIPSGNLASATIQDALNELQIDVDTRATSASVTTVSDNLTNHIADATDAHDASAISVVPTGNIAGDDVQEVLEEIQTEIDGLGGGSGASTTLNNLVSPTSVNQDLIPSVSASKHLGSSGTTWGNIYGYQYFATEQYNISNIAVMYAGAGTGWLMQNKSTSGATDRLFQIETKDINGATATGAIVIETGNNSTADSGNITIQTGTSAGTRGKVTITGREVDVDAAKIVDLATPTAATDAANKDYVDDSIAAFVVHSSSALPSCDSTIRGVRYEIESASGTPDLTAVCQKDKADAYEWYITSDWIYDTSYADFTNANATATTEANVTVKMNKYKRDGKMLIWRFQYYWNSEVSTSGSVLGIKFPQWGGVDILADTTHTVNGDAATNVNSEIYGYCKLWSGGAWSDWIALYASGFSTATARAEVFKVINNGGTNITDSTMNSGEYLRCDVEIPIDGWD